VKHERGKIGTALLFAVLIATLAFLSFGFASAAQQHYVNPGESIQGAIDNANAGDIIIVRDGTYTENVDVNVDHLTIKSEHGYDSTVVHAANTSDHVFEVTADYVNITGFTVTGATGAASDYIYTCGIYLYQAEHCIISDNNALNNWRGIYLVYSSNNSLMNNTAKENSDDGIFLYSSCNNSLLDNTVKDNTYGIYLSSSCNYNKLSDNTATNNTYDGIYLYSSSNNSLMDNTAKENSDDGISLSSSSNYNKLSDNTAYDNNNNGIYLSSSCNNSLLNNTAKGNSDDGIQLYSSSNNSLMANTVMDNKDGIYLPYSSNNSLMDNTVMDNLNGIYLSSSCNNTLTDNTATNNTYSGISLYSSSNNNSLMANTVMDNSNIGIYLYSSSNNLIYNNYFNNTNNARDSGNNRWNITKTAGINIIGGPYIGGNYWSDYAGEDLTEDGLGDTLVPYNSSGDIANGGDLLPLVKPSASSVFASGAGSYSPCHAMNTQTQ